MKPMCRFIFLGLLAMVAANAMAQKKVHNEHTYNQVASMEFKQWEFTPKDDYFSKVRKKILFIKYDDPGEGYHDDGWFGIGTILPTGSNYASYVAGVTLTGELERLTRPDHYVDEDWRKMSPLRASAYGEALLQKNYINQEEGYWRGIRAVDALTVADRSGALAQGLSLSAVDVTENDRNEASRQVLHSLDKLQGTEWDEELTLDYRMLQDGITTIRNAHMDDARKSVQLHSLNRQLEQLSSKSYRLELAKDLCDSVLYKGLTVGDKQNPFNDMQPSTLDKAFATGLQILEQLINFNKL